MSAEVTNAASNDRIQVVCELSVVVGVGSLYLSYPLDNLRLALHFRIIPFKELPLCRLFALPRISHTHWRGCAQETRARVASVRGECEWRMRPAEWSR
jgi:hypothetical protein